MQTVVLSLALLFSATAFTQISGTSGFKEFDDRSYKLTVDTEVEAVSRYQSVISANGYDSLLTVIKWGDNPIIFDTFRSKTKGMVNIGIVIQHEGQYDILFATIPNRTTKFFEVVNKDGDIVELIYEKR